MENNVDSQNKIGYNNNNDDEYAAIAGIRQHEQIIKMDEQKPLNDTECRHETLVANPEDKLGDAIYHGCTNPRCPVGFYIRNKKP